MCGIIGYISNQDITKFESNLVIDSLSKISHRGPDEQGQLSIDNWMIAHARLAIIDLSKAGKQPFVSTNGNLILTYNGEIYNFIELRAELSDLGHKFETNTDTEVLLKAWEQWGMKAIPKFIGMFAFCIIDRKKNKGWLVRDAFGIKPLFYSQAGAILRFASELPAIKALFHDDEPFEVNWQSAYNYLLYDEYDVGGKTFIDNIDSLEPGSVAEFKLSDPSSFQIIKWWKPNFTKLSRLTFDEAVGEVRKLFLRNVEIHLRSDAPLALSLSGGIDSSALAYAVRHLYPNRELHTFSYVSEDKEKSEEIWVDKVNSDINAIPHKIKLDQSILKQEVYKFLDTQGEPIGGTSVFAQYMISKEMQKCGFKVSLEGQGADEVFGGYEGYPGPRLRSNLDQFQFLKGIRFLKNWSRWPGRSVSLGLKLFLSEILPNPVYSFARKLSGVSFGSEFLNKEFLGTKSLLQPRKRQSQNQPNWAIGRRLNYQLWYQITWRGLPHLLRHSDRNMMAHSIESRVPFLTPDLAELMLSLPENMMVSDEGETKTILRNALKGIVPDEIAFRRDKIGFETPEKKWIPLLIPQLIEKLSSSDFSNPLVNKETTLKILHENTNLIETNPRFFWRLFNFIEWYDRFIANVPSIKQNN